MLKYLSKKSMSSSEASAMTSFATSTPPNLSPNESTLGEEVDSFACKTKRDKCVTYKSIYQYLCRRNRVHSFRQSLCDGIEPASVFVDFLDRRHAPRFWKNTQNTTIFERTYKKVWDSYGSHDASPSTFRSSHSQPTAPDGTGCGSSPVT